MNKTQIIKNTEEFAKSTLEKDITGHDYFHVNRVRNISLVIQKRENKGNIFIIELASLLHDIADWKFHDADEEIGPKKAKEFLTLQNVNEEIIDEVEYIVRHISFKGGTNKVKMRTIEGMIVQDADRLDSLGAIGIAKAFAYGGYKGREMYNPNIKPIKHKDLKSYASAENTTINHFYEKLLLLKDKMNTKTAKEIANERENFMKKFLEEFYREWEVKI